MQGKMIRNKRGSIIEPETLKLILAVIGLVLLATLGFSIYSILHGKTTTEQAKALSSEVLTLESQVMSGIEKEYLVLGPRKWFILVGEHGKRAECTKSDCLCICENTDCDKGTLRNDVFYCKEIASSNLEIVGSQIEIENLPLKLTLTKSGNSFQIKRV